MKVEVIIEDSKVYVRCDFGEWEVYPKSAGWLWVLGALHDGSELVVKDQRVNLQEHQHKMDMHISMSEK